MAYRPPALRNSQNNRLDFLRESRPTTNRSGWNTVQKKSYQKTYDNPNTNPNKPTSLPTHSSSGNRSSPVMNERLKFLNETQVETNVKKTFVAMPSEIQWDQGYRPAWILREKGDPPENYQDAIKIYKNYMKTGVISFPQFKKKEDKVKTAANQYTFKNTKKKKKS
jgi:hypothetical protein